jgi:outer membrane receptor protein involved in Fe transport
MSSAAGQAFAQTAAANASAAPTDAKPVPITSEIVVTASRIERAGYSAPTPQTVVGAEMLAGRAPSVLVDAIRLLPAFRNSNAPGTAGNSISGSGGGSFVNMRGLGPNRTLVLLNGERMVPTTNIGTVDISILPQSLVKRMDVVTGGASAAYGSDAVAGVVNVVLDAELTGLRANVEGGVAGRGDAGTQKASLAWGGDIGSRAHFVIGGEFYNAQAAPASDRQDRFYLVSQVTNPNFTPTNGQKAQIVAPYTYFNNMTFGGLIASGPLAGRQFLPGGALAPYTPCGPVSGVLQICPQQRNDLVFFQDVADLTTPQQRYSGYSALSYQASDKIKLKADFLYGKSTTVFHSVPPATSVLGAYTIQRSNAYLPAAVGAAMDAAGVSTFPLSRYSLEFGPSKFTRLTDVKRFSLGFDAEINSTWKANGYLVYGETNYSQRYDNALIPSKFVQQVDAVVNPANGQIVCRSTLTTPGNGCIPINLFGVGAPNLAAKSYSYGVGLTHLHSSQLAAGATVSGEPISTWAGPVSVVGGAEFRRDQANQTVDANQLAGLFAYSNLQPLSGAISVHEEFFETVIPLAKDMALAKTLELNGAFRETNYSTSGSVSTWKVGGNYEPVDGLRFRAVRSHDIRAPNILELNSATTLVSSGNVGIDPRTGQNTVFASFTGGNRFLKPEVADTLSFGAVVRPGFLQNFSVSLDYYDIDLTSAVQTLTNQQTLNECQAGNATICNFVKRDAAGNLISVTNVFANLAEITTRGFDLEASYHTKMGPGALDLRVLGNYLQNYIVNTGSSKVDYAGDILTYGIPKWGWDISSMYHVGRTVIDFDANYIGAGKYSIASAALIQNNTVDPLWYFGLGIQQTLNVNGGNMDIYVRADNLLDQKPPVQLPTANFGGNYDRIGRYIKLGIRFKM